MLRETDVERFLVRKVREAGGLALKFTPPGWAGAPDRIVLLPGGRIVFVELKAPGQKMRPLQEKRAAELEALGFSVCCLDSKEKIIAFMKEVGP